MTQREVGVLLLAKRVVNRFGRPFGVNPFPRAFPNPVFEAIETRQRVFDHIHGTNFWGSCQSRSGVGSEKEFTKLYGDELQTLIKERELKSMFDAPCGDLNWIVDAIAGTG